MKEITNGKLILNELSYSVSMRMLLFRAFPRFALFIYISVI